MSIISITLTPESCGNVDGSIVIVGTADLEPIKKIVVIKTGPNGEMSF